MSNEELLQPRYIVIADYPQSPQGNQIGFIYDRNNKDWSNRWFNEMSHCPHLFKKLNWWENRDEKEMPKYLKHTLIGSETTYHKIIRWDINLMVGYEDEDNGCNLMLWKETFNYLPATEDEYNAYCQTKS